MPYHQENIGKVAPQGVPAIEQARQQQQQMQQTPQGGPMPPRQMLGQPNPSVNEWNNSIKRAGTLASQQQKNWM